MNESFDIFIIKKVKTIKKLKTVYLQYKCVLLKLFIINTLYNYKQEFFLNKMFLFENSPASNNRKLMAVF